MLKEDDIQLIRDLYHCKLQTDFTARTTLRPPQGPKETSVTQPSNEDLQLELNYKSDCLEEISSSTHLFTQSVNNL